ncbi:MAG: hypothetical protein ACJZ5B_01850 [Candidatus Poseidoniaceae archaeon]
MGRICSITGLETGVTWSTYDGVTPWDSPGATGNLEQGQLSGLA